MRKSVIIWKVWYEIEYFELDDLGSYEDTSTKFDANDAMKHKSKRK